VESIFLGEQTDEMFANYIITFLTKNERVFFKKKNFTFGTFSFARRIIIDISADCRLPEKQSGFFII